MLVDEAEQHGFVRDFAQRVLIEGRDETDLDHDLEAETEHDSETDPDPGL